LIGHPVGNGSHTAPRNLVGAHLDMPIATHPRFSDPDAELVRLCQAGGPQAEAGFAQLVDRHATRIRRRAARILGNECDADDVVQEVFVNVHRFLDRYSPDRPFVHWLSVVTLNACRIELRRRAARHRRHDAYRGDPSHPTSASIEADPILRDWLTDALDAMPPKSRACILLRVLEGLSYREIAERCGLTEPAAKMRVLRGLRELRSRYEIVCGLVPDAHAQAAYDPTLYARESAA